MPEPTLPSAAPSRRMRKEIVVLAIAIGAIAILGAITLTQHRSVSAPDNTMVDPATYRAGRTTAPQTPLR